MMRPLGYMVRLRQVKSVNGGDEALVRKDAEEKLLTPANCDEI